MAIPLSILDLSPICEGGSAAQSLRNSGDLCQHAEALGYTRYWVAEHHNLAGNASSSTPVLVGYLASQTKTIRVGAGGVMLPNHAPLVVAEHFGTLESLYPGRIDLGLGRAPGTDQRTMRALRRNLHGENEDDFIADVMELQAYFQPDAAQENPVKAIPGIGLEIPIWFLGSSTYSAQVAAHFGRPFAFASHFSPGLLLDALDIYRTRFKPSKTLAAPYAAVAVNVVAADTDAEAAKLFTTLQQRFLGMQRNRRTPLQPPVDSMNGLWSTQEERAVGQMLAVSAVGSQQSVREQVQNIISQTGANEIIAASAIFDHKARKRSYVLLAQSAP